MLAPNQRVAVVARVAVGARTRVESLRTLVQSHLRSGAVGVCLESAPTFGVDEIDSELITAAAALTCVTVVADGSDVARATSAIDAGAKGLLVQSEVTSAIRDLAATNGVFLWMTGSDRSVPAGPRNERLVFECAPTDPALLTRVTGGGWSPEAAGSSGWSTQSAVTLASLIPDSASVPDGSIEALTTIAVAGGVRVLRSCDVVVVRRCADVAMELLAAREPALPSGSADRAGACEEVGA